MGEREREMGERERERETDRQTDRQTGRWTDSARNRDLLLSPTDSIMIGNADIRERRKNRHDAWWILRLIHY